MTFGRSECVICQVLSDSKTERHVTVNQVTVSRQYCAFMAFLTDSFDSRVDSQ